MPSDPPPLAAPPALPDASDRAALLRRMRTQLGGRAQLAERVGRMGATLGLSVHLVGGGVRDVLLGRQVLDLDMVVEGDAGALARALARRLGGRAVHHSAFGTAKWVGQDGVVVDLARSRAEHYAAPAALPTVSPASLTEDLARRDFSINAMALCLHPDHLGHLADPHDGWSDLSQRQLRVLHEGSFVDDPTRMFRAARFAARFGFRLAEASAALLGAAVQAGVLQHLGRERMGAEIDRILREDTAPEALVRLAQWGLLSSLSAELELPEGFSASARAVQTQVSHLAGLLGEPMDQAAALWVALGSLVPPETRMLRVVPGPKARQDAWLKAPESVAAAALRLQGAQRRSHKARALQGLSRPALAALVPLSGVPQSVVDWWVAEGSTCLTPVNGHRLMEAGVSRGPDLGTALAAAQDAAWDGEDEEGQLEAALLAVS